MGRLRRFVDLQLETLEDRRLLAGNIISGYVFDDLNGNGLRDVGELAIANSTLELRNASGVLMGTTTSDANGYYAFAVDNTAGNAQQSLVKTVSFADGTVNTIRSQMLPQFDSTLGTLQSIEFRVDGKIISDIKVENLSNKAVSVSSKSSGTVVLNGPGFNLNVSISGTANTKSLGAFDGIADFASGSGASLGAKTATGSNTLTLTGAAMNAFIGSGTVSLSFLAQATSQATGGTNLNSSITSQGGGQVTVTYRYLKDANLKAGNYTIKQKTQPTGYLDGRESQNNIVQANSFNTDVISVALGNASSMNNNFGEYKPATISGLVYQDTNNNGNKEAAEKVFSGIQIKLTGTDDRGTSVSLTATTNASGMYQFSNLRPGQYSVTEATQPKGASAGLLTVGSLGGAKTNLGFNGINVGAGKSASGYNFGHLLAAQASSAAAANPYSGKGMLMGSTPYPSAPEATATNPYSGKGMLMGSTPYPASSSTSSPTTTPPSANAGSSNAYSGKGMLMGSTPYPSAPDAATANPYSGKGFLMGSTPYAS